MRENLAVFFCGLSLFLCSILFAFSHFPLNPANGVAPKDPVLTPKDTVSIAISVIALLVSLVVFVVNHVLKQGDTERSVRQQLTDVVVQFLSLHRD